MQRRWLRGLVLVVGLSFIAGGWLWSQQPKLPASVRAKVNFTVFNPSRRAGVTVVPGGYHYDDQTSSLSTTTVTTTGSAKIIMSQQATPPTFAEAPQLYTEFVDKLGRFAVFKAPYGQVYLTRPANLVGGEAAVFNARGTLLIARSDTILNQAQWEQLFINLEIVR